MGDRCFVRLCIAERDLSQFQGHNFQWIDIPSREEWSEEVDWPGVISIDLEEVNYAGYSDWQPAAASGLRFLVNHGPGSDYGPGAYASDGKRAHFLPYSHDGEPLVVINMDNEPPTIDPAILESAQEFQGAWNAFLAYAGELKSTP
ncbi:MAG: hypothetical protein H6830_04460 [Planctomycetes bacterium]|nr:hypothetical protein [Planctomycetota bacterium]MCB9910488.1 hypothetical protein [Planctomycetota bacterium]MCB9912614.1 hypothetical protein [Planctomycetota bacterium]